MRGGSIFQKTAAPIHYYDQISIGGYLFEAEITTLNKRGDPSAIHCGRIITFVLQLDDEMVALYDDGKWYEYPDDSFGEGSLAAQLLISEWSKDKPTPFAGNKIPYHTNLF